MDHMYYMIAAALMIAGLLFRAGQRLQAIEGKLDPLKDVPERLTKVETALETLYRPRRRR